MHSLSRIIQSLSASLHVIYVQITFPMYSGEVVNPLLMQFTLLWDSLRKRCDHGAQFRKLQKLLMRTVPDAILIGFEGRKGQCQHS